MNESEDYEVINRLNNIIIFLNKYILLILYVFTNLGNILCILVFGKKSWRKNVCVFYFKIYLLYVTLYNNSNILAAIFNCGYHIQLQNSNILLCKINIYFAFLFATICPTVLILASIDRLLISSRNVHTRLYSSKRLAYFSISLATVFWILANSHLLFNVKIQEIQPSVYVCYFDSTNKYREIVNYILIITGIFCFTAMILLSMLTFKNVRHLPQQRRNELRAMTKKDFQLLRCLFAQNIVFIFFSIGINVFYVYSIITKNKMKTSTQAAIDMFFNDLCKFIYNFIYPSNFIIFISISKAFRQELKRIIYRMFKQNLVISREEDKRKDNVDPNVVVITSVPL